MLAGSEYSSRSHVHKLLPTDVLKSVEGKVVFDFGCGTGMDALEFAKLGARQVIGIDIQERLLAIARERAAEAGVQNVEFVLSTSEQADVVFSVNAFEHFSDPAFILNEMSKRLAPSGEVHVAFGPTWLHPAGGHLFSVFPWSHILLPEKALIRWRAEFMSDGAQRFTEVEGGLNMITIRQFERLVEQSPLRLTRLRLVPIRAVRPLHNRLTREFFTSVVQATLRHR